MTRFKNKTMAGTLQVTLYPVACVRRPSTFALNNFFSKTTRLISTKFGRKYLWNED